MKKLKYLLFTFVLLIIATQLFAQQNVESFSVFWKTYTNDSVFKKNAPDFHFLVHTICMTTVLMVMIFLR